MASTTTNLAEYMCYVVASLRDIESQKPDGIIKDPYAQILAGDIGAKFNLPHGFKYESKDVNLANPEDYMAIRTRYLDEEIDRRDPAIKQVVILAAGLDARAYRLESLKDCAVIEIDQSKELLDRKVEVLAKADAKVIAKSYHGITADLTQDSWADIVLAQTEFDPKVPTFWCIEGLLGYIDGESITRLVAKIDELSAPGSIMWADMNCEAVTREAVMSGRSLKYGEDDPLNGVMGSKGWKLTMQADLGLEGDHFGRHWTPMTLAATGELIPYYLVLAQKP